MRCARSAWFVCRRDLLLKRAENGTRGFACGRRALGAGRGCAVTDAAGRGAAAAAQLEIQARRVVAGFLCRAKDLKCFRVLAIDRAGIDAAADPGRQRQAAAGKIRHGQRLRIEIDLAALRGDRGAGQRGVAGDRHIGVTVGREDSGDGRGLGTVGQVDSGAEIAAARSFAAAACLEVQRQREFILLKRGHGQVAADIGIDCAALDDSTGERRVTAGGQCQIAACGDAGLCRVQVAVDEVEIDPEIALVGAALFTAATGLETDAELVFGVLYRGDGQLAADIDVGVVAGNDLRIGQACVAARRQVQIVGEGEAGLRARCGGIADLQAELDAAASLFAVTALAGRGSACLEPEFKPEIRGGALRGRHGQVAGDLDIAVGADHLGVDQVGIAADLNVVVIAADDQRLRADIVGFVQVDIDVKRAAATGAAVLALLVGADRQRPAEGVVDGRIDVGAGIDVAGDLKVVVVARPDDAGDKVQVFADDEVAVTAGEEGRLLRVRLAGLLASLEVQLAAAGIARHPDLDHQVGIEGLRLGRVLQGDNIDRPADDTVDIAGLDIAADDIHVLGHIRVQRAARGEAGVGEGGRRAVGVIAVDADPDILVDRIEADGHAAARREAVEGVDARRDIQAAGKVEIAVTGDVQARAGQVQVVGRDIGRSTDIDGAADRCAGVGLGELRAEADIHGAGFVHGILQPCDIDGRFGIRGGIKEGLAEIGAGALAVQRAAGGAVDLLCQRARARPAERANDRGPVSGFDRRDGRGHLVGARDRADDGRRVTRLDGLDDTLDGAGNGLGRVRLDGDVDAEACRAGGVLKVGDVEVRSVGDLRVEIAADIGVHRGEGGCALGGDDVQAAAGIQGRLVSGGQGFGLVEAGRERRVAGGAEAGVRSGAVRQRAGGEAEIGAAELVLHRCHGDRRSLQQRIAACIDVYAGEGCRAACHRDEVAAGCDIGFLVGDRIACRDTEGVRCCRRQAARSQLRADAGRGAEAPAAGGFLKGGNADVVGRLQDGVATRSQVGADKIDVVTGLK